MGHQLHIPKRTLLIASCVLMLIGLLPMSALSEQRPLARNDLETVQQAPPSPQVTQIRPQSRPKYQPAARWDFKPNGALWTRAAMSAVAGFGGGFDRFMPKDIDNWCPAYRENQRHQRLAFWVGMMSALAKHESTYRPAAVGGGDLWYGLLQIYPDTARRYGCRATSGEELKSPTANLSCAARIMAVTVARDRAIAVRDTKWRGVAADWGPMTKPSKIAEMSAWTRKQKYCRKPVVLRPVSRPRPDMQIAQKGDIGQEE